MLFQRFPAVATLRSLACSLSMAMLIAGCGGAPSRPSTAKVTGKVTKDGNPVANANVVFHSQGGDSGRPGTGRTDANGTFTIATFEADDGALIGQHKVTIVADVPMLESSAPEDIAAAEKELAKIKLPEKFATPDKTPISVEVSSDASKNQFEWDVNKL